VDWDVQFVPKGLEFLLDVFFVVPVKSWFARSCECCLWCSFLAWLLICVQLGQ